jgi:Family of unknown function (DUF5362)
MESNQNLLNSDLQIDANGHAYLAETAKWGTFLGIVGFILSGLIAIMALFAGSLFSSFSNGFGEASIIGAGVITFIYLLIALLYFFMSLYLYRFSTKMKAALYSNDQDYLNNAFSNLKSLYKLMGIITIIYLGFLALALLVGIGGALMR